LNIKGKHLGANKLEEKELIMLKSQRENNTDGRTSIVERQRGFNTRRITIVFFLGPTKPLPSYV
jgi:hypothetical protein